MALEWDRKVNVSGVVGILLGLGALAWNAYDWLQGANPVLFTPLQVLICRETQPFGQVFFRIATNSAYANAAPTGYPATVLREWITLDVAGQKVEQVAQHRVETSHRKLPEGGQPLPTPDCDLPPPGGKAQLVVAHKGVAAPFQVPGRGSVAHQSLFYPHPIDCPDGVPNCVRDGNQMPWDRFLELTRAAPRITVTLGADVTSGRKIIRLMAPSCTILVDEDHIRALETLYYYAFVCR